MNPSAPSIKGLIKIHKPDQPIWPVVNWRNAPGYKLSKLFTNRINHITPLLNAFSTLLTWSGILETPHYYRTSPSLHWTLQTYTRTRTILTNMLKQKSVASQIQQEILMWYDVITRQNYFANYKDTVTQYDGLAMGAPSSCLIVKMFLQNI